MLDCDRLLLYLLRQILAEGPRERPNEQRRELLEQMVEGVRELLRGEERKRVDLQVDLVEHVWKDRAVSLFLARVVPMDRVSTSIVYVVEDRHQFVVMASLIKQRKSATWEHSMDQILRVLHHVH